MLAILTLVSLGLATASFVVIIAVVIGYEARLRRLTNRLESLERRTSSPLGEGRVGMLPSLSPLQGIRFALSIQQDHPHPVLATLLKEALLKEDALVVEGDPDVLVEGGVVCNGYADVYFRADLTVAAGGQTLLTHVEKPPHGDRQENLAREVVARLKAEWPKRERRSALRELNG